MTAQNWKELGKFISIYNNDIFVIDKGNSKETIVILNGFPTSTYDYHKIIDELTENYRVIIHDHLGFGFSARPKGLQYSIIDQADIALRLWSELGLKEVTILAQDSGNSVAKEILARKNNNLTPIKINEIILTSSGKRLEHIQMSNISIILNNNKIGQYISILKNKGLKKIENLYTTDKQELEIDQDDLNEEFNHDAEVRKIQITSNYIKDSYVYFHRWTEGLKDSKIPIRIYWQKSDPISMKEIAIVLASEKINKNIEWIENSSHFSIIESPKSWLHLVFDHNGSNNKRSKYAAFF
ncbi:MAG: alpha/beta hydrolase [Polaribacter sp.]|uniref:alpha/beta hydrolase n=1 Tax=Polaribacter sp. TaxID=1920175 RepID=UPI003BAE6F0C